MEEQKTELKMIRMSEVESQEVKWLWYPFIPYGKLTIIQGDPGDGKTTLVLNIAAKLSKGECLDSDMDVQEPVNVIYQTAEDGLADTVKPRLEIAGADCEKILVIDESDKSLSMADERLEEALAKTGAKVLILDPIQAYLGGGMDMNRANIFFKSGMIEAWGRGFEKIREACALYDGPLPEYEINEAGIMVLCKACDRYLRLLRDDGQHPDHHPNQNGQDVNKLIIDFCKDPKSVQEIMDEFDFDSRTSFRRKYLTPMLKNGVLKMTIPEKPSSKNQKYFS